MEGLRCDAELAAMSYAVAVAALEWLPCGAEPGALAQGFEAGAMLPYRATLSAEPAVPWA